MTKEWKATEIARLENFRFLWHDARELIRPLLPLWTTLVGISMLLGLMWRMLPGTSAPDAYQLLDCCAVALWICGWHLAQSLAAVLRRRQLHARRQTDNWLRLVYIAVPLLAVAVALAGSLSAVLIAYSGPTILEQLSTLDVAEINVRLGALLFLTLLIGGTAVVLLASLSLLLAARLGTVSGPLAFAALTVYFNLRTLGNLDTFSAIADMHKWLLPTLGTISRGVMARLASPDVRYGYVQSLWNSTMGGGIMLVILFALLTLVAGLAAPPPRQQRGMALPCAIGVMVATVYAVINAWHYTLDVAVQWPGQWTTVFGIGLLSTLVARWLFVSNNEGRGGQDLLWPLLAICGWTIATLPAVRAGAVSQAEVLMLAVAVYVVLVVLLRLLSFCPSEFGSAIVAASALLSVPVFHGQSALLAWSNWATLPAMAYLALALPTLGLLFLLRARQASARLRLLGPAA